MRRATGILASSRAASAPPTAGFSAWYDGADSASMTLTGSRIDQWSDKSGNGRHLTRSNVSMRPTLTETINGITVPSFDGTDDNLMGACVNASAKTMLVVLRYSTTAGRGFPLGYPDGQWNFGQTTAGQAHMRHFTGPTSVSFTESISTTRAQLWTFITGTLSADPTFMRLNGRQVGANTMGTSTSSGSTIVLGSHNGSGLYFPGAIAEVVEYPSALTGTALTDVENHLMTKWGITPMASTPTSVPGLALWLDSSDASTFTFGTGSRVAEWRDKSGNVRHFTQSAAGNRPNRTAVQNGLTSVVFTGAAAEFMTAGDTLDMGTANLSVFVAGVHGTGSTETFIAKSLTGSGPGRWALMKLAAGTMDPFYTDSLGNLRTASTAHSTSWQTWGTVVNRSGGSISVRSGGVQRASSAFGAESVSVDTTNLLLLGAYGNGAGTGPGAGFYLNGQIGEVLVYASAPSGGDLQRIESYLRSKWGTP